MLYGEQMKLILDKFGIDTSNLPDNLYSTLLDAIYDNVGIFSGFKLYTYDGEEVKTADNNYLCTMED